MIYTSIHPGYHFPRHQLPCITSPTRSNPMKHIIIDMDAIFEFSSRIYFAFSKYIYMYDFEVLPYQVHFRHTQTPDVWPIVQTHTHILLLMLLWSWYHRIIYVHIERVRLFFDTNSNLICSLLSLSSFFFIRLPKLSDICARPRRCVHRPCVCVCVCVKNDVTPLLSCELIHISIWREARSKQWSRNKV